MSVSFVQLAAMISCMILKENTLLKAFVSSASNGHVYAEMGPGITGRIEQRRSLYLYFLVISNLFVVLSSSHQMKIYFPFVVNSASFNQFSLSAYFFQYDRSFRF